jgi:ribosomal protein S27AE
MGKRAAVRKRANWTEHDSGDMEYYPPDEYGATASITQDELGGPDTWSAYVWDNPTSNELRDSQRGFATSGEAQTWANGVIGQIARDAQGMSFSSRPRNAAVDIYDYPEGSTARCKNCDEPILLDQMEGGGPGKDWGARPEDWQGNGGIGMDYGCAGSADTDEEGIGGHEPASGTIHAPGSNLGARQAASGFGVTSDGKLSYEGRYIGNISLDAQRGTPERGESWEFHVRGVWVEHDKGDGYETLLFSASIAAAAARHIKVDQWTAGKLRRKIALELVDDRFCPECGADIVGNDPHDRGCPAEEEDYGAGKDDDQWPPNPVSASRRVSVTRSAASPHDDDRGSPYEEGEADFYPNVACPKCSTNMTSILSDDDGQFTCPGCGWRGFEEDTVETGGGRQARRQSRRRS